MAYLYQSQATLRADDFVRHVEHKRVADPARTAVRVMTIHQSKGLEFDTVVLPELDFSLNGQTPPFVTERPEPTAPVTRVCRYANAQVRQLLPRDIQQMFEDHANQEISESLCVLYVALTRAVQALHMFVAPAKETEKALPRTFAGLLRASLSPDRPAIADSVLFESGDRNWMRAQLPRKSAARRGAKSDSSDKESRPRGPASVSSIQVASTDRRYRGLERVSPSTLEGGPVLRLEKAFDSEGALAKRRGTVLHTWFQQIAWLEDGVAKDVELRALAARLTPAVTDSADLANWLQGFRTMLANPTIASQLGRAAYQKWPNARLTVETERPFAVPRDTSLLTGCIDRLVLISEGDRVVAADVIDFKTDQLEASDETGWQSRVEFYRPQMEAYREAVATLFSIPPTQVFGRLLFVSLGRIAEV
jgi:ATP-dependent exoDNAse (exonuclease V) beta subunit